MEVVIEAPVDTPSGLHVQVVGADAPPLADADVARLFPRVRPSSPRFDRIKQSARVLVSVEGRLVGVAVCQRANYELRVPELAISASPGVAAHDVLHALLDALEAACLAGGHRRLVLSPPARAHSVLRRRRYELISEGCAGVWMEKSFK